MKLIKEEKLDLRLKEREFNWNFEVEKEGIYGIEVLASCKSWWQNFLKSFFRDDELSVKIDGISFFKKSVAWIGNNLKGLKKTNFFVIHLQSGTHNLNFLASQFPFLESIRVYQIEESEFSFLPRDNYPIQDGNRRHWLTIVLVNLPIKALKIEASAEEGKKFFVFKRDDSDLKLIVNGEIQKNEEPKSHRNWYWCGGVLKGKEKIFERELNLKPKIHYIELWADRSPKIKEIKIILKKIPTFDSPEWTGNFYDDPEEIILARLIFGEARGASRDAKIGVGWVVKNRVLKWKKSYHEVILQPYQFSCFNQKDPNFPYLINPLLEAKAWYECYEIAQKIIKGEIENPVDDATHYHDISSHPSWADEMEFVCQIDNLKFYK